MKKGKSKNKGNIFELKMLRKLRIIYPDLHRTIGSGSAKDEWADMKVSNCPYLFEMKHYHRLSRGILNKFFDKVSIEAEIMNKIPILIYKENFKPIKVMYIFIIKTMSGKTECDERIKVMEYFEDWFEREKNKKNNI